MSLCKSWFNPLALPTNPLPVLESLSCRSCRRSLFRTWRSWLSRVICVLSEPCSSP